MCLVNLQAAVPIPLPQAAAIVGCIVIAPAAAVAAAALPSGPGCAPLCVAGSHCAWHAAASVARPGRAHPCPRASVAAPCRPTQGVHPHRVLALQLQRAGHAGRGRATGASAQRQVHGAWRWAGALGWGAEAACTHLSCTHQPCTHQSPCVPALAPPLLCASCPWLPACCFWRLWERPPPTSLSFHYEHP